MVSHEKILELIDRKQVDRLIPIVLDSKKFKESESLRVKLWDTFLPICHVAVDLHGLSDGTIEQLEKDIQRSFHHFKGPI
jgi:hypothetical protein